MTIRVIDIVQGTTVDGPGLRTSVYLAGCRHQCPGCHNPETWDFQAGRDMSIDEVMQIIRYNQFPVTLSGGDPLYQHEAVTELCRAIREEANINLGQGKRGGLRIDNPDLIWCYTGFRLEQLQANPALGELLSYINVLVDGPFNKAEKPEGVALRFRGSLNQRFICPTTGEERTY